MEKRREEKRREEKRREGRDKWSDHDRETRDNTRFQNKQHESVTDSRTDSEDRHDDMQERTGKCRL